MQIVRRSFLSVGVQAMLALALLVSACAPTPAAPTTAPAAKAAAPASPAAAGSPAAAASPSPAAAAVPKPATSPSPAAAASPSPSPSPSPAASPAARQVTLPRPEQTSITIVAGGVEPSQGVPAVAKGLGLYQKYGIDNVEINNVNGDPQATQVIISGGAQAGVASGSSSISSLQTDVPILTVGTYQPILSDLLVAQSSIRSADDLKGKSIAISGFGTDSHGSVILALRTLGLRDNEVNIVQIGGQSARLAALRGGSVQAAPVDKSLENEMRREGYSVLVSLAETPLRLPRSGLVMTAAFAQQNPNTVLALLAANLEAMQIYYTQPDRAADIWADWSQAQDKAEAREVFRDQLTTLSRDLRSTREAFEARRDLMVLTNEALKEVDVTKAFTNDYLDRLQSLGLYDALNVPRP